MRRAREIIFKYRRNIIIVVVLAVFWLLVQKTTSSEDLRPEDVDRHLILAEQYIWNQDFKSAAREFKLAINADNQRARTYAAISLILARNGLFKGSLKYAQRAEKKAVEEKNEALQIEALNLIYLANNALGMSKGSIRALEKALKLHPKDANLQNNLAYTYAEEGIKLDRALVLSKQSLLRQPLNGNFLDTLR